MTTEAYPDFRFRHKFLLLVVGRTQCGKTRFVRQILTSDRILYEVKKPRRISWYNNNNNNNNSNNNNNNYYYYYYYYYMNINI